MRKRGMMLVLVFVMAVSVLLAAIPAKEAAADGNPVISIDAQALLAKGKKVWFGNYNSSPVLWRVLGNGNAGSGKLLLSEYILDTMQFLSYGSNAYWPGSIVQDWCIRFYSGDANGSGSALSAAEQTAVIATTKADSAYTGYKYGNTFGGQPKFLNGDHVFFLSAEEAESVYFSQTDDAARIAYPAGGTAPGEWWLRSYSTENDKHAGYVSTDGYVGRHGMWDIDGARPAFNLDLNAVLFISTAKGGKSGAGSMLTAIPTGSVTEWKLTIKDDSRKFDLPDTSQRIAAAGETISIPYTKAKTGKGEYISAFLSRQGSPLATRYYASTPVSDGNGTAVFTLPDGLEKGLYKLELFNEQKNGDCQSDYASPLRTIWLNVDERITFNVTFRVVGGSWNDGTTEDKTVKLSRYSSEDLALTLSDEQIPAAGDNPDHAHKKAGEWDITPSSDVVISNDVTYTYRYAEKEPEPEPQETVYTVTVTVNDEQMGTASADPASGRTGTEVALTAEAKEGWMFKEWKVISGGVEISDNRFVIGTANVEIQAVFEKMDTVTAGSLRYKLDHNKKTAMVIGPAKKNVKKVSVPKTVKAYGDTYKVTAIGTGAFKGQKKLTQVTIGENVKTIGKEAFLGCKKLTKITIKTKKLTKKTIGKNSFKGISKKAVFKCPKKRLKKYESWLKKTGGAPKTAVFK